jgi:hypothetical protein
MIITPADHYAILAARLRSTVTVVDAIASPSSEQAAGDLIKSIDALKESAVEFLAVWRLEQKKAA